MGSNDDLVKVATNLLQRRLENLYAETTAGCYHTFARETGMPPPWVPPYNLLLEGRALLCVHITQWREKSLEYIGESFKSLVALMPQQHALGDMAKGLIGEVIDQVFQWKTDNRNTPTKFQEWLREAGFSPPFELDGLMEGLKGDWSQPSIPDQLNYDFRTSFEYLLDRLVMEDRLPAFATHPKVTDTPSEPNAAEVQIPFLPNEDYRSISVGGEVYRLTKHQALIVKKLHEAHQDENPYVSAAALRKVLKAPTSRLRDSFRSGDFPKFRKKWIVRKGRDMYALNLSPNNLNPSFGK
jgi:hypothetical protein